MGILCRSGVHVHVQTYRPQFWHNQAPFTFHSRLRNLVAVCCCSTQRSKWFWVMWSVCIWFSCTQIIWWWSSWWIRISRRFHKARTTMIIHQFIDSSKWTASWLFLENFGLDFAGCLANNISFWLFAIVILIHNNKDKFRDRFLWLPHTGSFVFVDWAG